MKKNETIILIPHYNDEVGLKKSLLSINEDEEVDVIVVDDGSKKIFNIEEIKKSFHAKGQVIFLFLEVNKGIEKALNEGIKKILTLNYNYIARLDTGDLCVGKRFKKQTDFLKNNMDYKLVGSHVRAIDINGSFIYNLKVPITDFEIRKKIYITSSVFVHPAIMFRSDMLSITGFYPINYKAAEDFAFYFNVIKHFKVGNIDEILLEKEYNPNSISVKKRKMQAWNRLRILWDNFHFGFYPIFGLVRNFMLYIIPINILTLIKKIFFNK